MNGRRVFALTRRIIEQFRRDRRTLALLFVVPIVVSAMLGWILTSGETRLPRVVATVAEPALALPVESALRRADGDSIDFVATADTEQAGRGMLVDGRADVLLVVPAGTIAAVRAGQSPTIAIVTLGLDTIGESGSVARLGQVVVSALTGAAGGRLPTLTRETVYGSPDANELDTLGPVFLGFFAYFFVFLLTGISFLRERIGGTLERLLATPIRRGEIIVGYSLGFGLFAALQVALLLGFALLNVRTPALGPVPELQLGLGIANAGHPLIVFAVVLLLALGAVNLGILLSTFARTELQILQFIPLVIVPQAFLGGLLWPIDTLPDALQALSRVLPMRYGVEALRSVMVRGAGLADATLQVDLIVLAGLAFGFVLLAGLTVRREVA